ncbi:hypothetical protein ACT3SZ_14870 [Corynebacterium sp. AOP40-9SA-29]|uniref:hypothetical protein n=1 Tax=Corynebacterium sp. AOP40-9SA-29 TaxID=3457677 RepID=UPI004033A15F
MALTQLFRRGLLSLIVAALVGAVSMSAAAAQDDEEPQERVSNCGQALSDLRNLDLGLDTLESANNCARGITNPVAGAQEAALVAEDAKDVVEEKIDGKWQEIVASIGAGALRGIMWTMTFWLDKPSNIVLGAGDVNDDGTPKNSGNLISQVGQYTTWLQGLFGVLSIMAIAVRFAMTRWSDFEDSITDFLMTLGRILVTSIIWVPLIMLCTRMSDGLAQWIITESSATAEEGMKAFLTDAEFPEGWKIATAWSTGGGSGTTAMILIASIVSIVTSVIQILFSFMREGMLVILCAVVPMVAYASGLESGREAWGKVKGWTIALLLFPPAAALVYAIAFLAVGEIGEDDSIGVMGILVIFGMAVLVLPSLISLVAPQAGVAPSGGSGMKVAGAIGTAAAAGAIAGGAGGAFGGGGSKAAAGASPSGAAGPAGGGSGGGGGGGEGGGGGSPMPGGSGGSGGGGGGGESDSSGGSAGSFGGASGGSGGGETGGAGAGASSPGGDVGGQPAGPSGGEEGGSVTPPMPGGGSEGEGESSPGGPAGSPGGATPPAGSPAGSAGGGGGGESGSPSGGGFSHGAAAKATGASLAASASGQQQPNPRGFNGPKPSSPKPPPVNQLRQRPPQVPSGVPR